MNAKRSPVPDTYQDSDPFPHSDPYQDSATIPQIPHNPEANAISRTPYPCENRPRRHLFANPYNNTGFPNRRPWREKSTLDAKRKNATIRKNT